MLGSFYKALGLVSTRVVGVQEEGPSSLDDPIDALARNNSDDARSDEAKSDEARSSEEATQDGILRHRTGVDIHSESGGSSLEHDPVPV